MKYLVLADIHSNFDALKTCLEDAIDFDRIICLGDLVGYGAEPNECVELIKKRDAIALMGNHDAGCIGLMEKKWFNAQAQKALKWTSQNLNEKNKSYLEGLPEFFSCQYLLAVHGTPMNPLREYMDSVKAKKTLRTVAEDLVLCGHTHTPFKFEQGKTLRELPKNHEIEFAGNRMVVNLPSVGQPRDGNPKAGYGILDFEKQRLEIRRIEYDIESAMEKIKKAGLPEFLAERLYKGI